MAEHSGYEQTNGRALESIEKFTILSKACVGVYPAESPMHSKVKESFVLYEDLAKKLFALFLLMKSQKTIESKTLMRNSLIYFYLGTKHSLASPISTNCIL